ncbi:30S ribosomal protein S1, partial [Enterococcus faecalis]
LHEGDQVQVKVLEVNPVEHRIALSIKALEPKPESQEEPKEELEYELPEENTGFSMGDILGDALSDAKEEE